MLDQFHSDGLIGKVHMPILIQHGERDAVVPVTNGTELFKLANEPKRLLLYPTARHDDLRRYGADTDVAALASEIIGRTSGTKATEGTLIGRPSQGPGFR
jgi:fermentation-respiration switch protein FrsA (DUF1100 family)